MLKSYLESFFQRLTGLKRNATISSAAQRDRILGVCKNIRAKEYIYNFDLDAATSKRETHTTTANWHFVLTNVSSYFHDDGALLAGSDWPKVAVQFENYPTISPYNTTREELGRVPAVLCFGREGMNPTGNTLHFEEGANLFYDLGQRFTVTLEAKSGLVACRGCVALTGIEINLDAIKRGEL